MGKRFDDLSKAFASGVSRRQALVGALGGVGAAVAAAVIPGRSAEADVSSANRCVGFCKSWCNVFFTNGVGNDPCYDRCVAEASMDQGPCFTVPGAPLYTSVHACHHEGQKDNCPGQQVCCNGRCCDRDRCVQWRDFTYELGNFNERPFTNGNLCLGCKPDWPY